jgi:small GTP-binding protein
VLRRFLTDQDEQILQEERRELGTLRAVMVRLDAAPEDERLIEQALQALDELFLLVVVGEFNSGKSAFINALLGKRFLSEGVTPTTTQINILRYGDQIHQARPEPDTLIITYPLDWLRDINIVDTPGTNAVILRHQEITEDFVPRADLVLFVTSSDRPFTESERTFLDRIRQWGKKVVLVVNKIDLLETPEDIAHVVDFVESNARVLLGTRPMVFPVSARMARQAKEAIDADQRTRMWTASQFGPLETFILHTLDERERLRLKLANPLGVASRMAGQYLAVAQHRRELLREDVSTLETIETQLRSYEADMRQEFRYHLSHIENVLYGMAERGDAFFDETIRFGRIVDLLNADRMQAMFERDVVADSSAEIDTHTHELIDWLVAQDYRQWQGVMDFLNRQIALHEEHVVGKVGGQFDFNRQSLLESVGRAAHETVASYDKEAEAKNMAESVQIAVAQTALVEVGAVGLGALVVHMLATTVVGLTGILAAGAIAILGLYLIPNKRRRAKAELHAKIADLRTRLSEAITEQFQRELEGSLLRIKTAIRPYVRFVETQRTSLQDSESQLVSARQKLQALRQQIEGLDSPVAK